MNTVNPMFTTNTGKTIRRCSRCRDWLTDPASLECGQGPICRKLDNTLYARTIPANFTMASLIVMSLSADTLPVEVQEAYTDLRAKLLKVCEKAARTGNMFDFQKSGFDMRKAIKTLDWMLSYEIYGTARDQLIKLVMNLGYVGLAGVLSQNASTGKAEISFRDGKCLLIGSSCKPGFLAMRKIPGVTLPRYRGDRTPFTVPAKHFDAFKSIVMEFWPNFTGNMDEIEKQTKDFVVNQVPVVTAQTAQETQLLAENAATLRCRSNDFILFFPWLSERQSEMYGFITALKLISVKGRKYNPADKSWTIDNTHKQYVKDILTKNGLFVINEVETGETTPVSAPSEPTAAFAARKAPYWKRAGFKRYGRY